MPSASIGCTPRTDLQCGPRCVRKSRGVAACRRSERPGRTKSGAWILSPSGLLDGRWFRVLTVVDQFTRECLLLLVDSSLTGQKGGLGTVAGDRRARNAGVDHGRYWHCVRK